MHKQYICTATFRCRRCRCGWTSHMYPTRAGRGPGRPRGRRPVALADRRLMVRPTARDTSAPPTSVWREATAAPTRSPVQGGGTAGRSLVARACRGGARRAAPSTPRLTRRTNPRGRRRIDGPSIRFAHDHVRLHPQPRRPRCTAARDAPPGAHRPAAAPPARARRRHRRRLPARRAHERRRRRPRRARHRRRGGLRADRRPRDDARDDLRAGRSSRAPACSRSASRSSRSAAAWRSPSLPSMASARRSDASPLNVGIRSEHAWVAALILMAVTDIALRAGILWLRREQLTAGTRPGVRTARGEA